LLTVPSRAIGLTLSAPHIARAEANRYAANAVGHV